jgi:hypothetical protein
MLPTRSTVRYCRSDVGGGVVRNVSVTRDGNLALACSGVNRVALVEIKNGGGTRC